MKTRPQSHWHISGAQLPCVTRATMPGAPTVLGSVTRVGEGPAHPRGGAHSSPAALLPQVRSPSSASCATSAPGTTRP